MRDTTRRETSVETTRDTTLPPTYSSSCRSGSVRFHPWWDSRVVPGAPWGTLLPRARFVAHAGPEARLVPPGRAWVKKVVSHFGVRRGTTFLSLHPPILLNQRTNERTNERTKPSNIKTTVIGFILRQCVCLLSRERERELDRERRQSLSLHDHHHPCVEIHHGSNNHQHPHHPQSSTITIIIMEDDTKHHHSKTHLKTRQCATTKQGGERGASQAAELPWPHLVSEHSRMVQPSFLETYRNKVCVCVCLCLLCFVCFALFVCVSLFACLCLGICCWCLDAL